jgi:hypothetical protein
MDESIEIGRVVGTEQKPNSAFRFHFWAKPGTPRLGIGSMVRVSHEEATVWGVVVEAFGFNDLESPLHEFLAVGGEAGLVPPTDRPEMRLYQADVLAREPKEPVGAVPIGTVFTADESDVRQALGTHTYADEHGVPCGVFGDEEFMQPIHLHGEFLLGPEAGHLNVTGTSGLAAKTSYLMFLLKSIFAQPHLKGEKGVAAVLFNTKGADLLYLDRPAPTTLPDFDAKVYARCGIEPGPFPSVEYLAPYASNLGTLATLRRNAELNDNPTRPITFGLSDLLDNVEVLLNRDDVDAKADSYLYYLRDRFVRQGNQPLVAGHPEAEKQPQARTIEQLVEIVEAQVAFAETHRIDSIDSHHVQTVRKMLNRLRGVQNRFPGVIARDEGDEKPFAKGFREGTITVIDVSQIPSQAQALVFSAVISHLQEMMEERRLGVDRLIVAVDELNKYAPSGGVDTHILRALKDIAARGRYMGLTLFGAQQFRSRVDKEVVGNAATHAFGHIEAEEMAQPGYSWLPESVREKLRTLPAGEMLIRHPHFKQPIFVRFPRPSWMTGSEGLSRFPAEPQIELRQAIIAAATGRGLSATEAQDLLNERTEDHEKLTACLRRLQAARTVDEGRAALRGLPRRPVGRTATGASDVAVVRDQGDPFDTA